MQNERVERLDGTARRECCRETPPWSAKPSSRGKGKLTGELAAKADGWQASLRAGVEEGPERSEVRMVAEPERSPLS